MNIRVRARQRPKLAFQESLEKFSGVNNLLTHRVGIGDRSHSFLRHGRLELLKGSMRRSKSALFTDEKRGPEGELTQRRFISM